MNILQIFYHSPLLILNDMNYQATVSNQMNTIIIKDESGVLEVPDVLESAFVMFAGCCDSVGGLMMSTVNS